MKHKGSTMEYSQERIEDLMRAYDEYISSCKYVRMPDDYKSIVEMPARRFWVSEIRATKVMYLMLKGNSLKNMRPLKREMFKEIYKRVTEMKKVNPDYTISMCCGIVVSQPAPKFYLTPGSAKIMVCKARKKWIQEKLKRLRLL